MAHTVSFVNISDVMGAIAFEPYEVEHIYQTSFNHVSWGDAMYTLIGNQVALNCILNGYHDYHSKHIANKALTTDDIGQRFWQLVNDNDYINMEN